MSKRYDLICIGRSGVDLYSDHYGSNLEETTSFSKYLGGCPANIAIGTAKLGLNVAMITRVGNEQMGRYMLDKFSQNGIDTQYIVVDDERLTTLVFLGIQDAETFPLLYYRKHCADMGLIADDIKEDAIANTKAILISGTHLSTPEVSETLFHAVKLAKKHGVQIIFDVDYRPTLWGLTDLGGGESRFIASQAVTNQLQKILPDCDMIVGTEEEFNIAGGSEDWRESLLNIRKLSSATFVYKMGALGCTVIEDEVPAKLQPMGQNFAIKILNAVGAGDAFMSGFLSAYLRDKDMQTCASCGNAAGALVVTRHSCSPASPSSAELEYFITNHKKLPKVPDRDAYFSNLHTATCRPYVWDNLHILAFDHRVQLEVMAYDAGYKEEIDGKIAPKTINKIKQAKQLVYDAFISAKKQFAKDDAIQFGIICDDRYGGDVLYQASKESNSAVQDFKEAKLPLPLWSARPIEKPLSRPLDFDLDYKEDYSSDDNKSKYPPDLALVMRHFHTKHSIKCLVFHHPDDEDELKQEQMHRLNRLYQLCQAYGLELLLEILPPAPEITGMLSAEHLVASMKMVYDNDVFPAWWKIAAPELGKRTQDDWDSITKYVTNRDEHCRGIVLLGADKPLEDLKQDFSIAAKQQMCRGYAIGRSIFSAPLKEWFAGKYDDAQTTDEICKRFTFIIKAWEESRNQG